MRIEPASQSNGFQPALNLSRFRTIATRAWHREKTWDVRSNQVALRQYSIGTPGKWKAPTTGDLGQSCLAIVRNKLRSADDLE